MNCPFCSNNKFILLHDFYMLKNTTSNLLLNDEEIEVKIEICSHCGLGINTTPMTTNELHAYYENYKSVISYFNDFMPNSFQVENLNLDIYDKYLVNLNSKIVEIGCNEGYFLDILQKRASQKYGQPYNNIMGIEPSDEADTGIAHGLKIDKAFFKAGYFQEKVDVFILRQVFEHLENPFDIFKDMISQLDNNGVIIIETPNLDVFCAIHLYYYSWPFYEKMAEKFNMKVIDCKITKPFDTYSNICIVFTKQESQYSQILCPFTLNDIINERKEDITNSFLEFIQNIKSLKKYINDNDTIYWWGVGGSSTAYLDALKKHNIAQSCQIIPVSLMVKDKGYIMPACSSPVIHVSELKNKVIEKSVFATMYVKDIFLNMEKYGITTKSSICIKGID